MRNRCPLLSGMASLIMQYVNKTFHAMFTASSYDGGFSFFGCLGGVYKGGGGES